jgi:hypothetical protein
MASDEDCRCCAREFIRLAGLTDERKVRDQLIDFAHGCLVTAQREERSDHAPVGTLRRRSVRFSTNRTLVKSS